MRLVADRCRGPAPGYHVGRHAPAYDEDGQYGYLDVPPPLVPTLRFAFKARSRRCEYPHGWNETDFDRDLGGIPRGGAELAAERCLTSDPFYPY